MEKEYQEIRDFLVREYEFGHEVSWDQLAHHLRDCGFSGSTDHKRGLGQKVSATYRRLASEDEIGRNALTGYFPESISS